MERFERPRVLSAAAAWATLRAHAAAAAIMVLLVAVQILAGCGSHLAPELHVVAIALITGREGPWVGLVAAGLAIATDWYVLLEPTWSFALVPWDAMRLVMLSSVAVLTWAGTMAMRWLAD